MRECAYSIATLTHALTHSQAPRVLLYIALLTYGSKVCTHHWQRRWLLCAHFGFAVIFLPLQMPKCLVASCTSSFHKHASHKQVDVFTREYSLSALDMLPLTRVKAGLQVATQSATIAIPLVSNLLLSSILVYSTTFERFAPLPRCSGLVSAANRVHPVFS